MASAALGTGSLLGNRNMELGNEIPQFKKLFNGKDLTNFVDINTSEETCMLKMVC